MSELFNDQEKSKAQNLRLDKMLILREPTFIHENKNI